jgi:hypothetical protein
MVPLLWRRIKRVRNQSYVELEPVRRDAVWEETVATRDDLSAVHTHDPNDDLIALAKRRATRPLPFDQPTVRYIRE